MKAGGTDPVRRFRLGLARVHQVIGWAGVAGVALVVAAAGSIWLAWSTHQAFLATHGELPAVVVAQPSTAAASTAASAPPASTDLPSARDIPLLLTQIKQAAVASGLDWRAADYRIVAATPDKPASLEVRCSVNGPYPKLRSMLVQLMDSVPAFVIREFGTSRPSADVPDVEAKLVLAVFLRDEVASAGSTKASP